MALSTLVLIGTGSAIVFVESIQEKRDPFPALMAESIFAWACLAMDSASDSHNLGKAFAALFLLSVVLMHGPSFIGTVTSTVQNPPKVTHKPTTQENASL